MTKIISIIALLIYFSFHLWSKEPRSMLFTITIKNDRPEYFFAMDKKSITSQEIEDFLKKESEKIFKMYGIVSAVVAIRKGERELTASELLQFLNLLTRYIQVIKIYDESKGPRFGKQFNGFCIISRKVSYDIDELQPPVIELPVIEGIQIIPNSKNEKETILHEHEHINRK